jgi:hypothetical protein
VSIFVGCAPPNQGAKTADAMPSNAAAGPVAPTSNPTPVAATTDATTGTAANDQTPATTADAATTTVSNDQTPAAAATSQGGYDVSEDIGGGAAAATPGPVRMARVSNLSGSVSWRPSDSVGWSAAQVNLPTRQGASFWAKPDARSELQFDDGSTLHMSGDTTDTLETMYSDSSGEFTEIKQASGLATYSLLHPVSEFQVDTPLCSVKAFGPASVRIGIGANVEVVVQSGQATVQTPQGTSTVTAGDRLEIANAQSAPTVEASPAPDAWDTYCTARQKIMEHQSTELPANINLVGGELDSYGAWSNDPQYGKVWSPQVSASWRPYSQGQWVWVSPVGWTWVDDQPWGWAPSHYGTWANRHNRWFWAPGPANQYWSPAVVSFSENNGVEAWCPLAPDEVQYPTSLAVGFSGGDWSVMFSIGSAGCYYPGSGGYCQGRPWNNSYINGQTNFYSSGLVNTYYDSSWNSDRSFYGRNTFIPRNASYNGASFATRAGFASRGAFATRPGAEAFFRNGNGYTRMPNSGAQVFGPGNMRPTATAFTPSRRFDSASIPPAALTERHVYRAAIPNAVSRQGEPMTHTLRPDDRVLASVRRTDTMASHAGNARPGVATRTTATTGRAAMHVASMPTAASRTRPGAHATATSARRASPTASHTRTASPTRTATTRRASPAAHPNHRTTTRIARRATSSAHRTTTTTRRSTATIHRAAPAARRASSTRSNTPHRQTPSAPQHSQPRSASAQRPQTRSAPPHSASNNKDRR